MHSSEEPSSKLDAFTSVTLSLSATTWNVSHTTVGGVTSFTAAVTVHSFLLPQPSIAE